MLTPKILLFFPITLTLGVMLSAACEARPDTTTGATTGDATTTTGSTTDPTTGALGQAAEPCVDLLDCDLEFACNDNWECQSPSVCFPWSGCKHDSDCVTVDGHAQTCFSRTGDPYAMLCEWVCASDGDCPVVGTMQFVCSAGPNGVGPDTCQPPCEESG